MLGRVVGFADQHERSQMLSFEKIKRWFSVLQSILTAVQQDRPLNYQMQNFKSKMQVKDLNEQTQMLQ
jgi:hypothetical protein